MTPDQDHQLRLLAKKYNIEFLGPIEQAVWPDNHKGTFTDVTRLGRTLFESYCQTATLESEDKPWRDLTRRRAVRLSKLAAKCRRERRNEAGWRSGVEEEVLARFTVEVACEKCRARLWRSEIEPTVSDLSCAAAPLEERRRKRVPCKCGPQSCGEDLRELGVNPLFSDKVQEFIIHDAPLRSELPKQEQPDRVFGLQSTKNFQTLLNAEDKRTVSEPSKKVLSESIKSTPFRQDGDPLLFPFLVLEAKSEKGQDSFGSIETQTAFSIRTLLALQEDLREATEQANRWPGCPLVWFFSNKGETWRVSAGYVENEAGRMYYRILDLWEGRIVSKDGALQLLLIVDYIFDWARDIYRPAILRGLSCLAASDAPSLTDDCDIFSVADSGPNESVLNWLFDNSPEQAREVNATELRANGVPEALLALDSVHGVIRHASLITSRLLGLCITGDNVTKLMESIDTEAKSIRTAREILGFLKDPWRITAETLVLIERKWTGKSRECEGQYDPQKEFYTKITFSAYLSPRWEQIRELSYLAVSRDGIDALLLRANLNRPPPELNPTKFLFIEGEILEDFCHRVQNISIEDNLIAAISRRSLSSCSDGSPHRPIPASRIATTNITKFQNTDAVFDTDHAGLKAREIVSSFYKAHKIGRIEPSQPFLRVSSRHDKQRTEIEASSFWGPPEPLCVNPNGSILLCSLHSSIRFRSSKMCLYVTRGPLDSSDPFTLQQSIKDVCQIGPRYTTDHRDKGDSWNPKTVRMVRNPVPDTEVVQEWLQHLGFTGRSPRSASTEQESRSCSPKRRRLRRRAGVGSDKDLVEAIYRSLGQGSGPQPQSAFAAASSSGSNAPQKRSFHHLG